MGLVIFLAVPVCLLFAYSLVSRRVQQSPVTPPMVFTAAGIALGCGFPGFLSAWGKAEITLHIAELGLVLLLFTDASRSSIAGMRKVQNLAARLLSTGMLLTILLGAVIGKIVFPEFSLWEAGILAAILAPTDAGLGQVIVSSSRVPARIRQALNLESGLNDGLSVPFLMFFMALAAASTEGRKASLMQFVVEQLGYGVVVGLVIGLVGGWLLGLADRKGWMDESFRQIGVVSLPLLCLIASESVGASMFIASFVAGLAVQPGFKDAGKHSVEFAEEWGQLLNLFVFFLFGLLVARDWHEFTVAAAIYAILSLTVVRMLPVAIALIGTHLSRASLVFMGWFGPRGLASIVLGLVYLQEEIHLAGESTIRLTVTLTVALSILLHGLSAMPGISLYARSVAGLPQSSPEHQEAVAA
jgi:sodium/hydrogen antiporter